MNCKAIINIQYDFLLHRSYCINKISEVGYQRCNVITLYFDIVRFFVLKTGNFVGFGNYEAHFITIHESHEKC